MAGSKFDIISGRAPGYWAGTEIRCRINQEFIADKVLSLNYDKIYAMGLPMALWQEATQLQDGLTVCSCFKDTSKQSDVPCQSCYGTGHIPGYFKFGTQNYWVSSIDAGWTLTNIVLDKENRPFRFMMDPSAITAVAISPNLTISTTNKLGEWEAKADAFTRDGDVNSSILVEASKDNGVTWFALNLLESQFPTTQLQFRVTMTRTAITIKSPMFEMVRARFATYFDLVDELQEPVIRVIPTWLTEAEIRQTHGTKLEAAGMRFWTLPLTFFNEGIALSDQKARVFDDTFVEVRFGTDIGYRYALTDFSYSDTFGEMTRQEFALRKTAGKSPALPGEFYQKVF